VKIYRNILCAVDFSEGSQIACARAAALTECFGSTLTLLHVIEHFPEDRSNNIIAPENVDPSEYRENEAHRNLAELAAKAGCNEAAREVHFSPRTGWHEIVHFAQETKVDLIILAEHIHHGPATLTASTARNVLTHVASDVLIVHAK
jgi:universal stress protein A